MAEVTADPVLSKAIYPDPEKATIDEFRSIGCEKYAYYLISTSLAGQSNTHLWYGIRAVLPKYSRVRILYFEKGETLAPTKIYLTRLKNGQYQISSSHRLNPVEGEHLEVCIPIINKGLTTADPTYRKFERCREIVEKLVAMLSLTYGRHCAMDIHAEYLRNTGENILSVSSNKLRDAESLLSDAGRSKHLSELLPDKIAYDLPKKVLRLIGAAEASSKSEVRFALFWTALEVAIGDGNKRRKFFGDELKSDVLNNLFYGFFKLRGDWFHDGKKPRDPERIEFVIKSAILLRFVRDPKMRQKVVSYLEELIATEKWKSEKTRWIQLSATIDYTVKPSSES